MATSASANDFLAFHDFVGTLVNRGRYDLTPEESVSAFRAYQQQLGQFQADNQLAIEQSKQGESKPLDVEALVGRVEARVAAHGTDN